MTKRDREGKESTTDRLLGDSSFVALPYTNTHLVLVPIVIFGGVPVVAKVVFNATASSSRDRWSASTTCNNLRRWGNILRATLS